VAAGAVAGTARAEVVDDNPAASSRAAGQVSVFLRGTDATLQASDLGSGSFTPWRSLGGQLSSAPGAEGRGGSTTDVFVRGTNVAMYQRYFTPSGGWSGWYGLGGSMLSAPGVTERNGGQYVDTYYRGPDNGIVAKSWVSGVGWTAENKTALDPGLTLSAPALVSRGSGRLDVIVRGTNDLVYIDVWNGSAWSGWARIPGGMRTQHAPAATTRRAGTFDVFVRTRPAASDGSAGTARPGRAGRPSRARSTRASPPSRTSRRGPTCSRAAAAT